MSVRGHFLARAIFSPSFAQHLEKHSISFVICINICFFPAGPFPLLKRTPMDLKVFFFPSHYELSAGKRGPPQEQQTPCLVRGPSWQWEVGGAVAWPVLLWAGFQWGVHGPFVLKRRTSHGLVSITRESLLGMVSLWGSVYFLLKN